MLFPHVIFLVVMVYVLLTTCVNALMDGPEINVMKVLINCMYNSYCATLICLVLCSPVCGNGYCVPTNSCVCNPGWTGDRCRLG